MIYFKAFFYSFVASLGFALLFNAPRRSIVPACIVGGISWVVYEFLQVRAYNYMLSAFLAAFIIGILGEIFSRKLKNPATLFILPGLIPLVPGAGMYYSMNQLIAQNYNSFIEIGAKTFFTAAALSVGIVASSIFSKSLRRVRIRKQDNGL